MIASVHGTVQAVRLDAAVVEVGGVGLLVHATPATLAGLRVGSTAQLATSLVVREDALTLFGFADADEREVFEIVQTVSGVGPRLALAMLAVHTPDGLRRAVLGRGPQGPPARARHRAQGRPAHRARAPGPDRRARPPVAAPAAAPSPAVTAATRSSRRSSASAGTRARPGTPCRPSWRAPRGRWRPTRSPACCARRCGAPGGAGVAADEAVEATTRGRAAPSGSRPSPLVQSRGADDLERAAEAALRPRRLDEFVGQRVVRDQLSLVLDAARRPRQGAGPRAALRPARAGQDDARHDHRRRDGRAAAGHQRPGHPARGRPRGRPVLARGGRGPLPRRDPPARAPRRGAALRGDGGLPGRRRSSARVRAPAPSR